MGPKNKATEGKCRNKNQQQSSRSVDHINKHLSQKSLLNFFGATFNLKQNGGSLPLAVSPHHDNVINDKNDGSYSQTNEILPLSSSCSPTKDQCEADEINRMEESPIIGEKRHRSGATGRCEVEERRDEDRNVIMLIEKTMLNTTNYPEGSGSTAQGVGSPINNGNIIITQSPFLSQSTSQNPAVSDCEIGSTTNTYNLEKDAVSLNGRESSWDEDGDSDDDEPALPAAVAMQYLSKAEGKHDELSGQQSLYSYCTPPRTTGRVIAPKRRMVQTQLDLGQPLTSINNQDGLVTCKLCGMKYQHCPDDIAFHKRHCKVLSKSRSEGTVSLSVIDSEIMRKSDNNNMQPFPVVRGMHFPLPKGQKMSSSTHRNDGALFDTQFELRAFTEDMCALLRNDQGTVVSSSGTTARTACPDTVANHIQTTPLITTKSGDRPLLGLNTILSGPKRNDHSVDSFLVEALLNSSTRCSNGIRSGKKSTRRNEAAKQKSKTSVQSLSHATKSDSSQERIVSSHLAPSPSTLLATLRSIATHRMFYSNNTDTSPLAPQHQESKREFLYFLINKPLGTWKQHGATAIDWEMVNVVNTISTPPLSFPNGALGRFDEDDDNINGTPRCSHSGELSTGIDNVDKTFDNDNSMSTLSCEMDLSICSQQTTPSVRNKIHMFAQHSRYASGAHYSHHPLITRPLSVAVKFFSSHSVLMCVSLPFHSAINEADVCSQARAHGGHILLDLAFICCYIGNPTRVHEPELHITNQASEISSLKKKADESNFSFKLRARNLRSYTTRIVQPTTQIDVSFMAISPKCVKDAAVLLPSAATFFGKASHGLPYIYKPLSADIRQHNASINIIRTGLTVLRNKAIYGVSLEFNQLCFLKYWLVPLGMLYYCGSANSCVPNQPHTTFAFEHIFNEICEEEETKVFEAHHAHMVEEVKRIDAAKLHGTFGENEEKENIIEENKDENSSDGKDNNNISAKYDENESKNSICSENVSQTTKSEKSGETKNEEDECIIRGGSPAANDPSVAVPQRYISAKHNSQVLARAAVRRFSIPRLKTEENIETLFYSDHGKSENDLMQTMPSGEELAEFILSAIGQSHLYRYIPRTPNSTHDDTNDKTQLRSADCHGKSTPRTVSKLKCLSVASRKEMRQGMKTPAYERLKVYASPGVLE